MARPPQNKHSAATSTELPTLHSTPSIKRSSSCSTPRQNDPLVSSFGNATDATNDRPRDYHHQVKATLTNILNDDRVKHDPSGTRCVQKILLENEQDMRKQRRHSLSACTAKRTMLF
ncbi:hypothetical protein Pdw03_8588 [Penicillium digitatum]|uniref:Uncharacterized protein n=3 Tax=Penicillium digitatum TaxID=36651 RepID=K9GNQ2_PEND2|nr:hypothetical protein PDIP_65060 [Penicillium digitatum Pd1]EKV09424.1 hypothetical protein PDIP_65060 [Penicillium digitatum Pd1]EKV14791.1 hypothetical protein PDIG_30680 [Penicillium digitatum PHI26]KAG0156987.1 hypothetical protein PDIDSM_4170 [Penicillium digitatum]QQK44687.1 hypothetical protein Pdw03_8588 [Penicillium digitatum]